MNGEECMEKDVKGTAVASIGGRAVKNTTHILYKGCKLDLCLTMHHQLVKVIQMNQLDATMIY